MRKFVSFFCRFLNPKSLNFIPVPTKCLHINYFYVPMSGGCRYFFFFFKLKLEYLEDPLFTECALHFSTRTRHYLSTILPFFLLLNCFFVTAIQFFFIISKYYYKHFASDVWLLPKHTENVDQYENRDKISNSIITLLIRTPSVILTICV